MLPSERHNLRPGALRRADFDIMLIYQSLDENDDRCGAVSIQSTEIIQQPPAEAQPYRAGTLASFSSNAAAAAVSASCFELPSATASASAPIEAFTVKRGAWCGPERSITS